MCGRVEALFVQPFGEGLERQGVHLCASRFQAALKGFVGKQVAVVVSVAHGVGRCCRLRPPLLYVLRSEVLPVGCHIYNKECRLPGSAVCAHRRMCPKSLFRVHIPLPLSPFPLFGYVYSGEQVGGSGRDVFAAKLANTPRLHKSPPHAFCIYRWLEEVRRKRIGEYAPAKELSSLLSQLARQ